MTVTRTRWRSVAVAALVAGAYLAAAKLSNGFASLYTGYAPFWPAAGLASGLLAILGVRFAPAVAVGSFLASAEYAVSPAAAVWFAIADTAEAALVALLIRRWPVGFSLTTPLDVWRLAAAALVGGAVSAGLGAPVLHALGRVPGSFNEVVVGWTLGNAIAHMVCAGALLVWSVPDPGWGRRHPAERVLMVAGAAAVSAWIFLTTWPAGRPSVYLLLAIVTWIAARLGQRAVALTLLGLSALAAWSVVPGTGPFGQDAGPALQLFLGISALSGYGIAAAVAQREEAAAVRDREARYRILADASPNLMWSVRPDGTIDFFNARAVQYTGLAPLDSPPMVWQQIVHPDDVPATTAAWEASAPGRRTCSVEHRLRRADGAYRWHWTVVAPAEEGPDGAVRWIGTATDIHDRKLAEIETGYWKAHLERAQTVGQLGSWEAELRGPDARLVWSNELFRIFGVSPSEFGGRNADFFARVHPDDRARVQDAVDRAVAANSRYTIEHRIVRPDGTERWVREEADVRVEADGTPVLVGVCQDITERVHADEERRTLEQSLLQAQKLESLGMLAGGIAHDFNNLLVGMLGNASLALLDLPPDAPARHAIRRIETSALRAADLVKQMLAYSGRSSLSVEPVDVSLLVSEMGELLGTVISKKAALSCELDDQLPAVSADPTQLRQVVMNLITNASDALGDRAGTIVIRTGRVTVEDPARHPLLAGTDAAPGSYVQLQVIDSGSGMDDATRARIFDPFFTTKFAGRGLGLAATLGIIRSHRGGIGVQSEPGRGTTFTVLLPASEASARRAAPQEAVAPDVAMVGGTVLVVDDEPAVRQALSLMLERAGYAVVGAATGREGVEAFKRGHDSYALVVLDMTMPDMNGGEVFAELQQVNSRVPVVLVTGYSEADAIAAFDGARPAAFLQKPFRPADLMAAVRTALERTSPARPHA